MINFVHRKNLDLDKYNKCVQAAINTRIYAYSWYLDAVSDQWGALIQDDYRGVMPLPYHRKWIIPSVVIPSWVQQLGVFTPNTLSSNQVEAFINAIPRRFKHIHLSFCSGTTFSAEAFRPRINYILKLNSTYEDLTSNYSKGRKSDLKKAKQAQLRLKSVDSTHELVQQFIHLKGTEVQLPHSEYQKLIRLSEVLRRRARVEIIEVNSDNAERLGGAMFLIDSTRITYLFSVSNKEGRSKNIMSLIIDHMIQKHANSERLLDFEGSTIDSIASFFKSFGAEPEQYYHYKKWRL